MKYKISINQRGGGGSISREISDVRKHTECLGIAGKSMGMDGRDEEVEVFSGRKNVRIGCTWLCIHAQSPCLSYVVKNQ